MIRIEDTNSDYELDLNKSDKNEFYITIDSRDNIGNIIPWAVIFSSNNTIKYHEENIDKLHLLFDLSLVKDNEYIIIENYKKEKARIIIKPNLKESSEKKFVFRIMQYNILEDNKIKFVVKSEINSKYIGWKCTYNGKPLTYDVETQKDYIVIELKSSIFSDVMGHFELTQNKSNKNINIELLHHENSRLQVLRIY